jgi:hypothetical protein
MNGVTMNRALFAAFAVMLLAQLGCLLIPEDTEKGSRVGNVRPEVRITGGAPAPLPSGIDYKINFQWHGTDPDGVVVRYQYAIDDTLSASAWRDTTGTSLQTVMRAANRNLHLDTIDPANPPPKGDSLRGFSQWHSFYVRAVDNEFAVSVPSVQYFNARTIAPSAQITFPNLLLTTDPELQPTVVVKWTGQDIDSSNPDHIPAFFEYKRVAITANTISDDDARDSLYTANNLDLPDSLVTGGNRTRWVRVPSSVTQFTISGMQTGAAYAFAVRAVDEAGAVEPVLSRTTL